jgi:tryptophan-rich sensory protein
MQAEESELAMKEMLGLVGWLAASFAAGWIGSRYMPGEWYVALAKPSWNPPNWIFGPVWTVLYMLMAVAAWRVWRQVGFSGAGIALGLFIVQLVLNALWSYLFFGLHRLDLAMLDILVLWGAILAVGVLFHGMNRVAGALMLPYLAWVSFAACLNFALWHLNRGAP